MSHLRSLAALLVVCFAATAMAAEGAGSSKTGPIKSVDAKARTFVLALAARPLTFKVDDKTAMTLDGKESTFEQGIKEGNVATVAYTRSGDDRVATKVEVKTKPAEVK